ncbi:hypothetical protein V1517DRAFT_319980 [Lipomyces orientalis]|uniref:Uncharacterized protein n=1 Tax=Lipomyces orientalis TaxID=1233043 RepID=A0ACC3TS05_9ASCO
MASEARSDIVEQPVGTDQQAGVSKENEQASGTVNRDCAGSGSREQNNSELGCTDSSPSDSHILAKQAAINSEPLEKTGENSGAAGAELVPHPVEDDEPKDLGWNQPSAKIHSPLIADVPNELLWMLMRRFNMQIYHVKAIDSTPPGGIDLNIADKEEFSSPDKVRTGLQRFYMTVFVGVLGFWHHMARLRSWNERRRTTCFCLVYSVCWLLDILMPTFLMLLILLIVYPPSRAFLFPPEPAIFGEEASGAEKATNLGSTGDLGSGEHFTGIHEYNRGKAAEKEAQDFVSNLASIAIDAAKKRNYNDSDSNSEIEIDQEETKITDANRDTKYDNKQTKPNISIGAVLTDPATYAAQVVDRAGMAQSERGVASVVDQKTKKPIEEALWIKVRPAMHAVTVIADQWERFSNALSPTPPFPRNKHRLRFAYILGVICLASCYVNSFLFMKFVTLCVGFGFFGGPIIAIAWDWLDRHYPEWKYYMQLRNNILRGVPTNAQLTITSLRLGEFANAPLPPQPIDMEPPKTEASVTGSESATEGSGDKLDTKWRWLSSAFRGFVKVVVKTGLVVNSAAAKIGSSRSAKRRLGIVPSSGQSVCSGPSQFKARHLGNKGYVYISSGSWPPTVGFVDESGFKDPRQIFSLPVSDISELRKIGGLGWKTEAVVRWALEKDVRNGLEIHDKAGNMFVVDAIASRDDLFNRLVAIGGQKWEAF